MVCDSYQTIFNDEALKVFYLENVSDLSMLHHSVADFFSMIFGGPNTYKGGICTLRKNICLSLIRFTGLEHMTMSFRKHGASGQLIKEIKVAICSFHDQIMPKKK